MKLSAAFREHHSKLMREAAAVSSCFPNLEVHGHRSESGNQRAVDDEIHRSEFMWPWETPPASVATGILDDETYDWATVTRGMINSDGFPIVVSEDQLIEANRSPCCLPVAAGDVQRIASAATRGRTSRSKSA
ncbi:MAG: hypothetical protein ACXW19_06680 [Thermoanaerobaculia bacterium]